MPILFKVGIQHWQEGFLKIVCLYSRNAIKKKICSFHKSPGGVKRISDYFIYRQKMGIYWCKQHRKKVWSYTYYWHCNSTRLVENWQTYPLSIFILSIYYAIYSVKHTYMWPWTTKPVLSRTGIFVAIDKTHCMGQNYWFYFYAKNH